MHRFRSLNLSIIVFWFKIFNYFNYWLIISFWPSFTWSRSAASTVFIRNAPLESLVRIVMNTVVFCQCIWRLFQHPEDCFYKWKQYSVNSWHIFVCSRAQQTHTIGFLIAAQYYYHHIACTVLQFKSILSSIIFFRLGTALFFWFLKSEPWCEEVRAVDISIVQQQEQDLHSNEPKKGREEVCN